MSGSNTECNSGDEDYSSPESSSEEEIGRPFTKEEMDEVERTFEITEVTDSSLFHPTPAPRARATQIASVSSEAAPDPASTLAGPSRPFPQTSTPDVSLAGNFSITYPSGELQISQQSFPETTHKSHGRNTAAADLKYISIQEQPDEKRLQADCKQHEEEYRQRRGELQQSGEVNTAIRTTLREGGDEDNPPNNRRSEDDHFAAKANRNELTFLKKTDGSNSDRSHNQPHFKSDASGASSPEHNWPSNQTPESTTSGNCEQLIVKENRKGGNIPPGKAKKKNSGDQHPNLCKKRENSKYPRSWVIVDPEETDETSLARCFRNFPYKQQNYGVDYIILNVLIGADAKNCGEGNTFVAFYDVSLYDHTPHTQRYISVAEIYRETREGRLWMRCIILLQTPANIHSISYIYGFLSGRQQLVCYETLHCRESKRRIPNIHGGKTEVYDGLINFPRNWLRNTFPNIRAKANEFYRDQGKGAFGVYLGRCFERAMGYANVFNFPGEVIGILHQMRYICTTTGDYKVFPADGDWKLVFSELMQLLSKHCHPMSTGGEEIANALNGPMSVLLTLYFLSVQRNDIPLEKLRAHLPKMCELASFQNKIERDDFIEVMQNIGDDPKYSLDIVYTISSTTRSWFDMLDHPLWPVLAEWATICRDVDTEKLRKFKYRTESLPIISPRDPNSLEALSLDKKAICTIRDKCFITKSIFIHMMAYCRSFEDLTYLPIDEFPQLEPEHYFHVLLFRFQGEFPNYQFFTLARDRMAHEKRTNCFDPLSAAVCVALSWKVLEKLSNWNWQWTWKNESSKHEKETIYLQTSELMVDLHCELLGQVSTLKKSDRPQNFTGILKEDTSAVNYYIHFQKLASTVTCNKKAREDPVDILQFWAKILGKANIPDGDEQNTWNACLRRTFKDVVQTVFKNIHSTLELRRQLLEIKDDLEKEHDCIEDVIGTVEYVSTAQIHDLLKSGGRDLSFLESLLSCPNSILETVMDSLPNVPQPDSFSALKIEQLIESSLLHTFVVLYGKCEDRSDKAEVKVAELKGFFQLLLQQIAESHVTYETLQWLESRSTVLEGIAKGLDLEGSKSLIADLKKCMQVYKHVDAELSYIKHLLSILGRYNDGKVNISDNDFAYLKSTKWEQRPICEYGCMTKGGVQCAFLTLTDEQKQHLDALRKFNGSRIFEMYLERRLEEFFTRSEDATLKWDAFLKTFCKSVEMEYRQMADSFASGKMMIQFCNELFGGMSVDARKEEVDRLFGTLFFEGGGERVFEFKKLRLRQIEQMEVLLRGLEVCLPLYELKDVLSLAPGDFVHLETKLHSVRPEDTSLGEISDSLMESMAQFNQYNKKEVEALVIFTQASEFIKWIKQKIPSLQALQSVLALAQTAVGSDKMNNMRIKSLSDSIHAYAPILYGLHEGSGLNDFLKQYDKVREKLKDNVSIPTKFEDSSKIR